MCCLQAPESLLKEHYDDLKDRPFFPSLVSYMNSGPVCAMVRPGSAIAPHMMGFMVLRVR